MNNYSNINGESIIGNGDRTFENNPNSESWSVNSTQSAAPNAIFIDLSPLESDSKRKHDTVTSDALYRSRQTDHICDQTNPGHISNNGGFHENEQVSKFPILW